MVDKKRIMEFLKQYFDTTGEISIDDRGFVTCKGDVTLKHMFKHERLPVSFDRVEGDFICLWHGLTTLQGAPRSVGGNFMCSNNQLTTLQHAPQSVDDSFLCTNNQLTTLEGAPKSVGGSFWCSNNKLTTLQHAPQSVDDSFDCSVNQLTTMEHAPKSVGGDFWCSNNKLATLEGLSDISGTLRLSYSPTLPLLRCLLAKKVEFRPNREDKTIETILNQYAGQGEAGAFACGAELASAGYKENAKW